MGGREGTYNSTFVGRVEGRAGACVIRRRAGGRTGGSAGRADGLANVRDILIYDKWLLDKLPVCEKYVIIILGQMALGVKMLSDTITMSATSKYEVLQKPFSRTLIEGHKTTRTRRRINRQTDTYIKNPDGQTGFKTL